MKEISPQSTHQRLSMLLFAGLAMCYGWGWRGSYGHEVGAMVPGALVAMAVCLASARRDWYRRSVVAGLCGAVGWSWGGTLTNMEHRLYILSDTPADVFYGFAGVGLVGLLWCGVGGGILAMAFTRPRSELNRFIGPLSVMGLVYALSYLYFWFYPERYRAYADYTATHWHDGEWLAALTTPLGLLPYWALRVKDRPATALIIGCSIAWWLGYLGLTKIGGIELAPPNRSESWGGVVGIQAFLIWHHWRNGDRAAVMFTLYCMLTGCIAFILALQIHVPFQVGWGPFQTLSPWKQAEESFGFFMGLGVAWAAGRLIHGRLAPAGEDADRGPLDVFGAFVLLVVMMWINLKQNVEDWSDRYKVLPTEAFAYFKEPFPQLEAWHYFLLVGILWSLLAIYCIVLYRRGQLALAPQSAFAKGALIFVVIVVVTLAGVIAKKTPSYRNIDSMFSGITFLVLAGLTIWMLLARSQEGLTAAEPEQPGVLPSDVSWNVGRWYAILWAWVPIHIFLAGIIAMAMEDGAWCADAGKERHRFGPNATWRLEKQSKNNKSPKPDGDQ